MIAVPRIPPVSNGQKLDFGLINHIIKRTEYASELLRKYRCVAGDNMFVEPHPDGTRVSYLQAVGGGIRKPLLPYPYPSDVTPPTDPSILTCLNSSSWSKSDYFNSSVCPNVGPPCGSASPSCSGLSVSGYIISSAVWPNSCLANGKIAKCSYSALFDDSGNIGNDSCSYSGCIGCSKNGIVTASVGSYNQDYFFIYINYSAQNGPPGGPYGFIGSGAFFIQ